MQRVAYYKGCWIYQEEGGFSWEECIYSEVSDGLFATLEEAKADIDDMFGDGTHVHEIDGEVYSDAELQAVLAE